MTLIGCRLSAGDLTWVLDDPTAVTALLFGDLGGGDAEMPESALDVEKSWHGLHYLLTGTAWEISDGAGSAILGGDPIGPDNGYGPARLLTPDAVRSIATALEPLDTETLRARFNAVAMTAADIYPSVWRDIEEFDGYLAPYYDDLRTFYRTAADNGDAVLLTIT